MTTGADRYAEPEPLRKRVFQFLDETGDVIKVDDRSYPGDPPRLVVYAPEDVWLDLDTVRLLLVALIGWLKEHAPEEGLMYRMESEDGAATDH